MLALSVCFVSIGGVGVSVDVVVVVTVGKLARTFKRHWTNPAFPKYCRREHQRLHGAAGGRPRRLTKN